MAENVSQHHSSLILPCGEYPKYYSVKSVKSVYICVVDLYVQIYLKCMNLIEEVNTYMRLFEFVTEVRFCPYTLPALSGSIATTSISTFISGTPN